MRISKPLLTVMACCLAAACGQGNPTGGDIVDRGTNINPGAGGSVPDAGVAQVSPGSQPLPGNPQPGTIFSSPSATPRVTPSVRATPSSLLPTVSPPATLAPSPGATTGPATLLKLSGQIYNGSGGLMTGPVQVRATSADPTKPFDKVLTALNGTYELDGVPAGAQLAITVSSQGYYTRTRIDTYASAEKVDFGGVRDAAATPFALMLDHDPPRLLSAIVNPVGSNLKRIVLTFSKAMALPAASTGEAETRLVVRFGDADRDLKLLEMPRSPTFRVKNEATAEEALEKGDPFLFATGGTWRVDPTSPDKLWFEVPDKWVPAGMSSFRVVVFDLAAVGPGTSASPGTSPKPSASPSGINPFFR